MIDYELDASARALQELVASIAADTIRPELRLAESEQRLTREAIEAMEDAGLGFVGLPLEEGGFGLDFISQVAIQESLAHGDVASAQLAPSVDPLPAVLTYFGTAKQQDDLYEPFTLGNLPGIAVALWEDPHDTRPQTIRVTASPSGSGVSLNGRKVGVSFRHPSDFFLVAARPPGGGPVAFYGIQGNANGIDCQEAGDRIGLRAMRRGELVLDGARVVGQRCLLPGPLGDKAIEATVSELQLRATAHAVGLARAAYEYAAQYSSQREAFGKPIAGFQAIAFMVADMATLVEAARDRLVEAAWQWQAFRDAYVSSVEESRELPQGGAAATARRAHDGVAARGGSAQVGKVPQETLEKLETARLNVLGAYLYALDAAKWVTSQAVQILGGHGYVQDHPLEKWMRDASALSQDLADPACLRVQYGEMLLKGGGVPALAGGSSGQPAAAEQTGGEARG